MTRLIELLLIGLSLGAIYTLIALGFVVIYKATRVVNFAQGSILLLGVFLTADLHDDIGFWPAVLVGIAAASCVGVIVQRVLWSRIRSEDHLVASILTIGVDVLLATELARRIGSRVLTTGDPWADRVVTVAGFTVPQARLAAAAVAALLIAGFFAAFKYTGWGVAMRAAAEDGEAASLMGIRLGRVAAAAWLIGAGLAAVAGVFLAGFPSAGVDAHAGVLALSAVPAVIVGGLDSTGGAVVGGLVIGLIATVVAGYEQNLAFLGNGIGAVSPYIVAVLVLLWRPSGLFGTKEFDRV
ncbi:branched-chain amino acid ABC transporter permease [Actinomadura sp. 3N407]|uniref:branched-chain amino acid ABC transporter permease n=1 Tax=Actinomadura sp. 3N407 TaxID=3457423 RepID=UPI003FCCC6D2